MVFISRLRMENRAEKKREREAAKDIIMRITYSSMGPVRQQNRTSSYSDSRIME
jgi:hypothetical protein